MYSGLPFGPSFLLAVIMLWPRATRIVFVAACLIGVLVYLLWPNDSAIAATLSDVTGYISPSC